MAESQESRGQIADARFNNAVHDKQTVGESNASDGESQQSLEVVFEEEENSSHRRKSSLVPAEAAALARQHETTACFIHSLLEDPRRRGNVAGYLAKPSSSTADEDDIAKEIRSANAHSRFLTKKQLAEMAWGVRELSKHLGGIRLRLHVHMVFILTKAYDESLIQNAREITQWLLSKDRDASFVVYVEKTLENNTKFDAHSILTENPSSEGRLRYWTDDMCVGNRLTFDFVITLGGDGTVLYASWLFQRIVPPVLSFALGSLGFLTKFDYSKFPQTLSTAFKEGVTVSLRLRFEGTVMRSRKTSGGDEKRDLVEELVGEEKDDHTTHQPDGSYVILNDIVVDRGPSPTMSSTELFGDDEHFTSVQADGICVATPTGSTAYNLAAGGSLCHPENPVILVTAICAHTLSFRPIILPDTIVLRVGVPYDARTSAWASFDGRERVELHPGDYVTISASRYPFANVLPQGRRSEDWISSIRRTLQWNSRQRQKSFKEWTEEGEEGAE